MSAPGQGTARAGSEKSTLVFDIGMHTGEDTAHYLRRGHRVVAVEASSKLCKQAEVRFRREIEAGQLIVVNAAIADTPRVRFYNSENDQWGTIRSDWVLRNARLGAQVTEVVEVPGTTIAELIERFGAPYYIKTDIEGADHLVLESLATTDIRPAYLSIESSKTSWREINQEIDQLVGMGYSHFQAIPQHTIMREQSDDFYAFPFSGSSGRFGDDLPGEWLDEFAIRRRYRRIWWRYRLFGDETTWGWGPRRWLGAMLRVLLGEAGWWDTHARHSSVTSCLGTEHQPRNMRMEA